MFLKNLLRSTWSCAESTFPNTRVLDCAEASRPGEVADEFALRRPQYPRGRRESRAYHVSERSCLIAKSVSSPHTAGTAVKVASRGTAYPSPNT